MCSCACLRVRVHEHAYVCANMRVSVLAYGCKRKHAWVRACAYAFACVLRFVHACVYVCERVRTCVQTCARACTITHVPVCLRVHLSHRFACMYCARAGVRACTCARMLGWVHAHMRKGRVYVCRFYSCIISALETFSGVGLHALLILILWCSWCCCF